MHSINDSTGRRGNNNGDGKKKEFACCGRSQHLKIPLPTTDIFSFSQILLLLRDCEGKNKNPGVSSFRRLHAIYSSSSCDSMTAATRLEPAIDRLLEKNREKRFEVFSDAKELKSRVLRGPPGPAGFGACGSKGEKKGIGGERLGFVCAERRRKNEGVGWGARDDKRLASEDRAVSVCCSFHSGHGFCVGVFRLHRFLVFYHLHKVAIACGSHQIEDLICIPQRSFLTSGYLIASMGLQVLWSLGLACLDIYALRIKRDLQNPILVSLFVVGDWVTATLSLAAACSSAGVTVLFTRDINYCKEHDLPCGRFQISIAFAFITWLLIAVSSLVTFWLLVDNLDCSNVFDAVVKNWKKNMVLNEMSKDPQYITVLVVGSIGHIGQFVVKELICCGFHIVSVARKRSGVRDQKTKEDTLRDLHSSKICFSNLTDVVALNALLRSSAAAGRSTSKPGSWVEIGGGREILRTGSRQRDRDPGCDVF
ncbi:hypothetical protein ACLOJK_012642 [Asimina triloba]